MSDDRKEEAMFRSSVLCPMSALAVGALAITYSTIPGAASESTAGTTMRVIVAPVMVPIAIATKPSVHLPSMTVHSVRSSIASGSVPAVRTTSLAVPATENARTVVSSPSALSGAATAKNGSVSSASSSVNPDAAPANPAVGGQSPPAAANIAGPASKTVAYAPRRDYFPGRATCESKAAKDPKRRSECSGY